MIRYRYADLTDPAGPFLYVTVANPISGQQLENIAGQIDTAADRTVVPRAIVELLGLAQNGSASFLGFAGSITELPLYIMEVLIHDLSPIRIRAVVGEQEPWILLGRDALNMLRILLDGPNLKFEIS